MSLLLLVTVLQNRPAHFSCPVKGKPLPEITWKIDDKQLSQNSELIQYSNMNRDMHILK